MADYIKREDAIDTACSIVFSLGGDIDDTVEMETSMEEIPAADVRPVVRGKWEDVNVRDYSTNINGGLPLSIASMFCPICGRWHNEVYHYGNPTEMTHFCPNCGADMREEQND